jgi:acyl transferase domain-containing protein
VGHRRASVNSFGFGGSNAHVVIEDSGRLLSTREGVRSPTRKLRRPMQNGSSPRRTTLSDADGQSKALSKSQKLMCGPSRKVLVPRNQLLVLSAADQKGLERLSTAYSEQFEKVTDSMSETRSTGLLDLAFTLNIRRSHLPWRAFALAKPLDNGSYSFTQLSQGTRATTSLYLSFIFTGQGAQWPRMGMSLMCYTEFRIALEECENYFKEFGSTWHLLGK